MLSVYTEAFGLCAQLMEHFRSAAFEVTWKMDFVGGATSIIATKAND